MEQFIPSGLQIPPNVDARSFILSLPALGPDQVPDGADTTMTTNGPDQVWFLVVAIICIAIPGIFMMLRLYTRLAIMRCLEPADCKLKSDQVVSRLTVNRFLVLSPCMMSRSPLTQDALADF
jgi:hypothetical protein